MKQGLFEKLGYKEDLNNQFADRLAKDMAEYPLKETKSELVNYFQERYTHQEACIAMAYLIDKINRSSDTNILLNSLLN